MKPDQVGDFLVRFLSVSLMMDQATKPVPRGSAPPAAGAIEEARRSMFELRGEARQLIIRLNEEAAAAANGPVAQAAPVLSHGRRPSWWQDGEVRDLVTRLHRLLEIDQAVALCRKRFGIERAPSRSSLNRYWMKLDSLARESRR
ncbi:hypothetical protein ACFPOB_17915 [Bosea eneae]|uniref:Uncharacterized protein n=1 Tax=Bosea eneae TaxID=151454 RepID=A0ABW0IT32_9HYPH